MGIAVTERETDVLDRAVVCLREVATEPPRVGIILGSGLGGIAEAVEGPAMIPFCDVPGFPHTGVDGHHGRVVFGRLEGQPCVVLAGRAHLYEGHTPDGITVPPRALARLGVESLFVTSAAGSIDRTFNPGDLMVVADHIDLMGRNVLDRVAEHGRAGVRSIYDPGLRRLAERVALEERIRVVHGVYAAVLGPSYETPAEIRMLARLGAHAVGMSMVPEATAASAAGLRVLGISLITNRAAGLGCQRLAHDEVLAGAAAAAPRLERLVRGVIARLFTEPRATGR